MVVVSVRIYFIIEIHEKGYKNALDDIFSIEITLYIILGIRLQDSAFLSEVAVNHLKKARGEIWPKRSERRNNTKTTKMRTKSPQ